MNHHLKDKSDINRMSAEALLKLTYYSSAVHCSYYSCYQYLKHYYLHLMNRSEKSLDDEIKRDKRVGSHEVLINIIIKDFNNSGKNSRILRNNISALKRLRVRADYENEIINSTHGLESINLSKDILSELKNY